MGEVVREALVLHAGRGSFFGAANRDLVLAEGKRLRAKAGFSVLDVENLHVILAARRFTHLPISRLS